VLLMKIHSHRFVETYQGPVGFGFNRETDENTLVYYLQKFSDDTLMDVMKRRFSDQEMADLFDRLSDLLRRHLSDSEYHALFLNEQPSS
jgi:hypothetical protein